MTEQVPRLRSDAQENRDRILDAGRELFSERGLGVTMREVARHAGVGPATLYRHFPARDDLVDAVLADEFDTCRRIVTECCADLDPWRGLRTFVERTVVHNVGHQGFADALMLEGSGSFTAYRAELVRRLADLIRRAKAAGELRDDVVLDDVLLVLFAVRGLAASPATRTAVAARRFAVLMLESFRVADTNGPLPRRASLAAALVRPDEAPTSSSRR